MVFFLEVVRFCTFADVVVVAVGDDVVVVV